MQAARRCEAGSSLDSIANAVQDRVADVTDASVRLVASKHSKARLVFQIVPRQTFLMG